MPRLHYRFFKTSFFSKAAKKADIRDDELCAAILQVLDGKADDLGGGVFKKRLNNNMHRSIILAKGKQYWVFEYLFAKSNRDNIDDDELLAFRSLAKHYASLTNDQLSQLLLEQHLKEICNDNK